MLMHEGGIESAFETTTATLISRVTEYPEGLPEVIDNVVANFPVKVQPHQEKSIDFLKPGGERQTESLVIYPLCGELHLISLGHLLKFADRQGVYKITSCDVRPSRGYAKVIASKIDDR